MTARWKRRPEGSNWGDFGPDDQIGRLNLLTPERRLQAVREVKVGRNFCLSLPLDLPGGNKLNANRYPPTRSITERKAGHKSVNYPFRLENPAYIDAVCDDAVTLFTQYSTQWDALSHVGQHFDADGDGVAEVVYYNGYRGGESVLGPESEDGPGAKALGIERMAVVGVQGRGVLVDLEAVFGADRTLVGYDGLMRALAHGKVEVEEGDMLCLHTGFARMVLEMAGNPDQDRLHNAYAVLDGRDTKLHEWITDSGVSVLIADNYAVEAFPNESGVTQGCAGLPLHQHCLFKLGIHLGELWYLSELNDWLREAGRTRFLLTAPPLRLPGSFGSPVTPIATV